MHQHRGVEVTLGILFAFACGADRGPAPQSRAQIESPPAATPSEVRKASATASTSLPLSSKIDPIFAALGAPGHPGCAVGIYRAGDVLLSRGYGLANVEHAVAMTSDDVFDIASISKQFTAMAVLLLEREMKLSLEDDVRKYVPEIPDYGHVIRLRHLLHHTAGLRDYNSLLPLAGREFDRVTDEDLLRLMHMQLAPNFSPGTRYEYSNVGYVVLGVVVRRVAGMSLAEFERRRIFEPLEMKNTLIMDDHRAAVRHRATGYLDAGLHVAISRWEFAGPSRVGTTVDDLAKWDSNFYEPRVGDHQLIAEMRTIGTLDDGKPLHYAGGLVEERRNGRRVEEHSGGTAGYRSELIRFPDDRLTVACLCNSSSIDVLALTKAVSDAVLPPVASDTAARLASQSAPEASESALDLVVGAYYDPLTFEVLRVQRDQSSLKVGWDLEPSNWVSLTYVAESQFTNADGRVLFRFEPGPRGAPGRLVRSYKDMDESDVVMMRFEPWTPAAAQLAEYAGRYSSDEVPRELELSIVDGKLRSGTWGVAPDVDPMTPTGHDRFQAGWGGVAFERDASGRIRAFVASGDGFHGIRFVRREARLRPRA